MTNIKSAEFGQVKNDMISFSGLNNLFLFFNTEHILQRASITKSRGIYNSLILLYLCLLHFKSRRSISEGLVFIEKQVHKSTINNFLNNTSYDWRKLLTYTAKVYHKRFPADRGNHEILVVDDTSKEKTGRKVEYLGKFRDHCNGRFYWGYQVIFMALSNLRTCIPIDFVIKVSNPKKKKRKKGKKAKQFKAKKGNYARNSHSGKRVAEAKKTKFELCVEMIKRALKHRFKFNYVAWDSWYNCSESFKFIFKRLVSRGIHLVSMIKLDKTKYRYAGERLNPEEIFEKIPQWQQITEDGIRMKSVVVEIEDKSDKKGKTLSGKVKMCFYKFPGHKDYKAIICTKIDLSAEEILEIYGYRWQIEVMIKDIKQHFGYNRAMSSKYAPQVADLSVNCMFYIMICTLKERKPQKSQYQLLLALGFEFETYCYEIFFKYKFKTKTIEFVDFVIAQGITYLSELRASINTLLNDFLNRDFHEDKITEIDNEQNEIVS